MSGYIGTQPVPQATQTRDSFTATSGQTSFATGGYTPNFLDVYLNGVKLAAADYTATNGSDVVLASGAATGDILEVVAFTLRLTVGSSFTPSIDDNGNATAITIDSNENVGIGTSSPSRQLSLLHTSQCDISLLSGSDTNGGLIYHNASEQKFLIANRESDGHISFQSGGTSERMRIDSSGNLLVGKTSLGISNAGHTLAAGGYTEFTRTATSTSTGGTLNVGRNTYDGPLTTFWKDGSTVGYVGTYGGDLTVGTGDTGVRFIDSLDTIVPISDSAGTSRDAAIDLGYSSIRYKDLYLSGGVYLGGTGSANKLDDYEEGTWTPSPATGSWTVHSARYTKVGRLVNCSFKVTATTGGTGGDITGLPFTALDGSGNGVVGFQNWDSASWTVHVETSKVSMRKGPTSQTLGNATSAYVTFTYFTA